MVCDFVCLASGVGKTQNGFGGKGDWICLKCFYHNHANCDSAECPRSEFYLNINPKLGLLEFRSKEPGCAAEAVEAFRHTMESF